MERFDKLLKIGQSIWYDNIQRRLLINGEMKGMIERGEIRGVTSNPAIFNNAIAKSNDYDEALKPMALAGWKPEDIFYQLAVEDISAALDLFRPLYDASKKGDGYVSLEVSPFLARKTEETFNEAKKLWERVNKPNLMIKIPATMEGLPAITRAIAAGINVNVTLIFSIERYNAVMDAYLKGLEERAAKGLPLESVASVASFFVSRVDAKIDAMLQKKIDEKAKDADLAKKMLGKTAIANSKLAYQAYLKKFNSERFEQLKKKGARIQRPLWASTSSKNPAYKDTVYVDELIGPDTVNTTPPPTLVAFVDHGVVDRTIDKDLPDAEAALKNLPQLGIDLAQVTRELEDDGVKAFADSFTALIKTIEDRSQEVRKQLASAEKKT